MAAILERFGAISLVRTAEPADDQDGALPLTDQLEAVATDPLVRVLVIQGPMALVRGERYQAAWEIAEACRLVAGMGCATIAVIEEDCLGSGFELALAADIRVARDGIVMGFRGSPMASYSGSLQRLAHAGGQHTAFAMMVGGEPVEATQASRLGLVAHVLPSLTLRSEAMVIAREIAACAPLAVRAVKEVLQRGLDQDLGQGFALEADYYMSLHATHDRGEGIQAFLDKRPPSFSGY